MKMTLPCQDNSFGVLQRGWDDGEELEKILLDRSRTDFSVEHCNVIQPFSRETKERMDLIPSGLLCNIGMLC
jgi:hypothetical protein